MINRSSISSIVFAMLAVAIISVMAVPITRAGTTTTTGVGSKLDNSRHRRSASSPTAATITTVAAAGTQTAKQATDSAPTIAGTNTRAVQSRTDYTYIPIAATTTAETGSVSPDDTSPNGNRRHMTNRPRRTGTNTESQPSPANPDGATHLRC